MIPSFLRPSHILHGLRHLLRNDQLLLAFLALFVGGLVGSAVILFREAIGLVQALGFGSDTEYLEQQLRTLPWWQVLAVPTLGGLAVGLFLARFMPDGRPQGVAHVIEACAVKGGRMDARAGIGAALASAVSLGVGASVGREGPAVHLGASLGAWFAARLHLTRTLSRTLLGCGVAAAVAASFNAPIAGALFATEVVVGHYGLGAFAPIVIASVTGTMISRGYYGDFPAFFVGEHQIATFLEFPAFAGLGLLCGLAAIWFLTLVRQVEDILDKGKVPRWSRPMLGGFTVGLLGIALPEVMGVGYGATDTALEGGFPLAMLALLAVAKLIATAVCLGSGFAGGVFSPSLVIGALIGGAYGTIAFDVSSVLSAGSGAYVLVGMAAMASAVLGAPISTTLIIFEMTGDYALTTGVMIGTVLASVLVQQLGHRSFFHWQLSRRGLDLHGGFASALLRSQTVATVMKPHAEVVGEDMSLPDLRSALQMSAVGELFVLRADGTLLGTITLADLSEAAFDPTMDDLINAEDVARRKPPMLCPGDDLERALKLIRDRGEETIAVVEDRQHPAFLGIVRAADIMSAYNRSLIEARAEEHGDR